ncbi:hypothetical protein BN3662_00230 [Clostridiales bacterium CHKCI006]|nr:hypothetical protein BN3662_00230 [Clostridiales bacterium CHKCI006]
MKCPVCKDVTLLMAERHGVEIDYCPECRGIWLDRGELEKIISASKAADHDEIPGAKHKDETKKKKKRGFVLTDLLEVFGEGE